MSTIKKVARRALPVLLWLICLYFAFVFVPNGIRKFNPEGFWAPAFNRWGYAVWFMYIIGVVETVGGLLILVPRVRIYGAFPLAVVMLGALATRILHGVDIGDAVSISFNMVAMLFLTAHSLTTERELPEVET